MASDTRVGTLRLADRVTRRRPSRAAGPAQDQDDPGTRNVYYCGIPDAALRPEFSKSRPVIIVSYRNSLTGPVLVVPVTTQPQLGNAWAVKLGRSPTPGETCDVWVVCNHLYSVSCQRLSATRGTVPRLTAAEFRPVHELVLKWIPTLDPAIDICRRDPSRSLNKQHGPCGVTVLKGPGASFDISEPLVSVPGASPAIKNGPTIPGNRSDPEEFSRDDREASPRRPDAFPTGSCYRNRNSL